MKKIVLPAIGVIVLLASCQQSKKDMLAGTWNAVNYENPEMDAFFAESAKYIDTLGANGNAQTNYELYGSTNVDSIRNAMRMERQQTLEMQMQAIKKTTFTFTKEGKLMVNFNGKMDTGNWSMKTKDASSIELEELSGPDKGRKTPIDILKLKGDSLMLKIIQDNTYTTITFNKAKN
jgi:hypothetical protein